MTKHLYANVPKFSVRFLGLSTLEQLYLTAIWMGSLKAMTGHKFRDYTIALVKTSLTITVSCSLSQTRTETKFIAQLAWNPFGLELSKYFPGAKPFDLQSVLLANKRDVIERFLVTLRLYQRISVRRERVSVKMATVPVKCKDHHELHFHAATNSGPGS